MPLLPNVRFSRAMIRRLDVEGARTLPGFGQRRGTEPKGAGAERSGGRERQGRERQGRGVWVGLALHAAVRPG
jgi:hypothetical protein